MDASDRSEDPASNRSGESHVDTADEPRGWRGWVVPGWVLLMATLILAPLLAPGYVLNLDMVFVPQQTLLPWMLGLEGGLPRAVPQDLIVSVASGPVPGQLLQKAVLVAVVVLAGLGAAKVLGRCSVGVQLAAASIYVWNAYLAERLVMGNWSLLLGYASAPWILLAVIRVRSAGVSPATLTGQRYLWGWPALWGWSALASWVPSGGLLALTLSLGLVVPGAMSSWRIRLGGLAGVVAINLPWVVPALLHGSSGAADAAGVESFALRADGPWGALLTGLSLGGTWNADAVPISRRLGLGLLLGIGLLVLAFLGVRPLLRRLGSPMGWYLTTLALLGVLTSVSVGSTVGRALLASIPGAGLLRDSQKPLALLALWLAIAAPLGLRALLARIPTRAGRRALIAAVAVGPLLLLPDLGWGVGGRLSPVSYPSSWARLREYIAQHPGDVLALPWSTFRVYEWNADRTVVDPLPRYLTTTVVADSSLVVYRRSSGKYLRVAGDDPRAARVGAAIEAGTPLAQLLPALGINRVVVQLDQPTLGRPVDLRGMTRTWSDGELEVWSTGQSPADPPAATGYLPILAANLIAAAVVLVAAVAAAATGIAGAVGIRRRRADPQRE